MYLLKKSLATRTAYGQDPGFQAPPRFLAMTTGHGAVFESAMFPDEAMLTEDLDYILNELKIARHNVYD